MSCRVALHVEEAGGASLHIGAIGTASLEVGGEVYGTEVPPYEGEYTVTPGEEQQTLPTAERLLRHDVVIEPIPSNYGRIEWDGTSILVY